jgi:hypothetical protein
MKRRRLRRTGALLFAGVLLVASILPAAATIEAEEAFLNTWARTDYPVVTGNAVRTWMWGEDVPLTEILSEPYVEHPLGERTVQYWDKSRMEINDPNADSDDLWYVTNGLLAKELMTGRMQLGHTLHEQHAPASDVHVAGDPADDTPTYAMFGGLMDVRSVPPGSTIPAVPITQTVDADGEIGNEEALGQYEVFVGYYAPETDHVIASVFWDFMNSTGTIAPSGPIDEFTEGPLFENPVYAVGLPLTEAYWVYVPVQGEPQWVLVQAFERRVLTYTPGNDPGWQVEAGNVGQHYYMWRYGDMPEN